jgi:hypothetical protein
MRNDYANFVIFRCYVEHPICNRRTNSDCLSNGRCNG